MCLQITMWTFNEMIKTKLQENWNTFSVFIAGICFFAIMSTDPDSKNPKVLTTPFRSNDLKVFLIIFQATRTAAVALIMSILWIMAPIPGK